MTWLDRYLQKWRIRVARRELPPGARVLDIGTHDGTLFCLTRARGVGIDPELAAVTSIPGVTLVKGDLRGIVRARLLSQATMRNIRQNLFFAFVYNSLGVPIAAGVLYPFFGLLLSPIIAAAAMSFSSVSVVGNALRLRRVRL